MGLILDTTEFILAERAGRTLEQVLSALPASEGIGVSIITVAELQHGVRRAVTDSQRLPRQRFLDDLMRTVTILPISIAVALRAGDLSAELEMRGGRLPFPDLIIAATAVEYGFGVVTHNARHFNRVPGLQVLTLP
jgi:tRNA(fMet)-specific endonuclease VapC